MKPVYIFDLDGTIALNDHRQHFVHREKPDWQGFFNACDQDVPNWPVIQTLAGLRRAGAEIWIWSGRSESVKEKTLDWLMEYRVMDNRSWRWINRNTIDRFRMRGAKDFRPDVELKEEWLLTVEPIDRRRIIAVFDDRQSVVDMWRSHGIACFQVAEGNF